MGLFQKLNRSGDLATGMAERRGVNFADRILKNPEVAGVEFQRILLRCSGCRDQDACAKLQSGCDQLEAAPDYCMNKTFFDGY